MELLNGVEEAFILSAKMGSDPAKLKVLRDQWKNLIATVFKVGDHLIDKLGSLTEENDSELKFQAQRFEALSLTAKLVGDIKRTPVTEVPDVSRVKRELKRAVTDRLDAAVEGKRIVNVKAGQEFQLTSTPEELNSLRATNTERWMNDVLKWQALDLNMQRRFGLIREDLIKLKEAKMKVILDQMEARVDRELAGHSLESVLDFEAERMLASTVTQLEQLEN